MAVILIVDDQPGRRMHVMRAIKDLGCRVRTLSNAAMAERLIDTLNPDLVLLNRQPESFDSIPVFLAIKEKYPKLPVLLYALRSETAVKSLKQAVAMVFDEIRCAAARHMAPPTVFLSRQLQGYSPA